MAVFEPNLFFAKVFPDHKYSAELVAEEDSWRSIWRCQREGDPVSEDKEVEIPSFAILKHTPSFIRRLQSGLSFVWKQPRNSATEAIILELFGPKGTLHHLNTPEGVRVPHLIQYDLPLCVMVMEDLGRNLLTLDRLFTREFMQDCKLPISKVEDRCGELGRRIGAFLAALHSRETLHESRYPFDLVFNTLPVRVAREKEFEGCMARDVTQWVTERLLWVDPEMADRVCKRIHENCTRYLYPRELCVSLLDMDPSSIVVSSSHFEFSVPKTRLMKVGVIN
jgi:hypothetical protein